MDDYLRADCGCVYNRRCRWIYRAAGFMLDVAGFASVIAVVVLIGLAWV